MIKRFEEILFDTPECHDFRRMANGDWTAYANVSDDDGAALRNIAPTIREALEGLQQKIRDNS